MIKYIMLGVPIIFLLMGCKSQPTEHKNNEAIKKEIIQNKSSVGKVDDFEILERSIFADTLLIISTSDFLYYPFGSYKNMKDFTKQYSFMQNSVELAYPNNDSTAPLVPVYRFSFNHSYIKYLYDDEKEKLEIIAAKIFDSEVSLSNQVKIGITKSDFIKMFTDQIKPEQIRNVKVIKFASGLQGIWQYYIFDNDILISFYIDTDYQFDKN